MPSYLWKKTTSLTSCYTRTEICRTLGLNSNELKARLQSKMEEPNSTNHTFVEFGHYQIQNQNKDPGWQYVEFEQKNGGKNGGKTRLYPKAGLLLLMNQLLTAF